MFRDQINNCNSKSNLKIGYIIILHTVDPQRANHGSLWDEGQVQRAGSQRLVDQQHAVQVNQNFNMHDTWRGLMNKT